jgi:hypothetical protein
MTVEDDRDNSPMEEQTTVGTVELQYHMHQYFVLPLLLNLSPAIYKLQHLQPYVFIYGHYFTIPTTCDQQYSIWQRKHAQYSSDDSSSSSSLPVQG